jgi:hypothetical protein
MTNQSPTIPRTNRRALRQRPRGLRGNIGALIFQPRTFFRDLAAAETNRQWFWIAVFVLGLTGFVAVQRSSATAVVDPFAATPPPAAANWTTALLAASGIVASWLVQAVLLCEVSLLNGVAPRLGLNFRAAIWASLPLGLMALLQLLYMAAGGTIAAAGVSGLVVEQQWYTELPAFPQSLMLSLTSQLTVFWLWNLVLLYLGARHALKGKWWASLLVIVAWLVVVILIPTLANTNTTPAPDPFTNPQF